jgi:hypothetical protein
MDGVIVTAKIIAAPAIFYWATALFVYKFRR